MRFRGVAWLYWVLMVLATSSAQVAMAQQFYVGDEPAYFDDSCLNGEIPDWFRDMVGSSYDNMCLPDEVCENQNAQTRSIEFQTYCQGNLIVRCLEQVDSDTCLSPLIERLRSDASRQAFELGRRMAENDLSNLPKLLKRRLTNSDLTFARAACVPDSTLKYLAETYDVTTDVYCIADRVSDLRISSFNLHYTLDRYGVPR